MTPAHDSKSARLGRVEAIDALRGLAALAVVLYHARGSLWSGTTALFNEYHFAPKWEAWLGYSTLPLSFGWLGVTLFFVLSGYCIHRRGARHLAKNPDFTIDLPQFFGRRFWRIYPTYCAALLLTGLVDWHVFQVSGFRDPGMDDHRWSTLLVSLLGLQGYFAPTYGSNGVFWTLAMEIHLYLAYPVLFWGSKRYGPQRVLLFTGLVSAAFAVADAFIGIQKALPYHFLRGPIFLPYWFTWTVGFYLAEVEAGRAQLPARKTCGLLAGTGALGGLLLVSLNLPEASEMPWALFFGAAVWWSLGEQGRKVWDSLAGRAMAFIGVFSYSLYAMHYPMFMLYRAYVLPDGEKPFSLIPLLGGVCFSLLTAWGFFQLVERWSIRSR